MSDNPTLKNKAADVDGYLTYDWIYDINQLGATSIVSSDWMVLSGSVTLDGYLIDGYLTTVTVHGGVPWEMTQIRNTVVFDTTDTIDRVFTIIITNPVNPNYQPISFTQPSLSAKQLGNDVPFQYDWIREMEIYGAVFIETSFWVVTDGSILIEDGRTNIIEGSKTTTYVSGGIPWEYTAITNSVLFDNGTKLAKSFTLIIRPTGYEAPNGIVLDQELDSLISEG